jgi:hypothetical protein
MKPRARNDMEAEASFKLAVWFKQNGDAARADQYFKRAQTLDPGDWNCHRQDWSFTPEAAGKLWLDKFQKLETPYYPALEMKPQGAKPPGW